MISHRFEIFVSWDRLHLLILWIDNQKTSFTHLKHFWLNYTTSLKWLNMLIKSCIHMSSVNLCWSVKLKVFLWFKNSAGCFNCFDLCPWSDSSWKAEKWFQFGCNNPWWSCTSNDLNAIIRMKKWEEKKIVQNLESCRSVVWYAPAALYDTIRIV